MNVHLIDRSATERKAGKEVVDCLLITAEEEAGKRLWMLLHFPNRGVEVLVGEDRQKRPKDLVLHDGIVPGDGIDDGGIDIACLRVGRATCNDLLLIDKACEALDSLWADDAGVVVEFLLRVCSVQLDYSLLALLDELLGD